jgi:hypothetical protein
MSDILYYTSDIRGITMSDGPHKSLLMRRGWKKFAERADKAAFEPEQISEAAIPALECDWQEDVSPFLPALRAIVGDDRQLTLFGSTNTAALEALERLSPGNSLGRTFVGGVARAIAAGQIGEQAVLASAANALLDRGARAIRQVEEHYLRRAGEATALKIRARMEEGISRAPIEALARRVLGIDPLTAAQRLPKPRGLDDGVVL